MAAKGEFSAGGGGGGGGGGVCGALRSREMGDVLPGRRASRRDGRRGGIVTDAQLGARLQKVATLEGHHGCVNRLAWDREGTLLASVSDDLHLMLWDARGMQSSEERRCSCIVDLETRHEANMFGVAFMPQSGGRHIATAGMDQMVLLNSLREDGTHATTPLGRHSDRVKNVDVVDSEPFLCFTSGEDGQVIQWDLRLPQSLAARLVNFPDATDVTTKFTIRRQHRQVKHVAMNQMRPHYFVFGTGGPHCWLFDRRAATSNYAETARHLTVERDACVCFAPVGIASRGQSFDVHATHVAWDDAGRSVVVNYHNDSTYTFDMFDPHNSELHTDAVIEAARAAGHPVYEDIFEAFAAEPDPDVPIRPIFGSGSPSKEAIRSSSEWAQSWKEIGNSRVKGGDVAGAWQAYSRALRRTPRNVLQRSVLLCNRAHAGLRDGGTLDEANAALADATRAMSIDPSSWKAAYRRIRALVAVGMRDIAIVELATFAAKWPEKKKVVKTVQALLDARTIDSRETINEQLPQVCPIAGYRSGGYTVCIGHKNFDTDIKEAAFFGSSAGCVLAASDCGNMFVYDRESSACVAIVRGDDINVNCIQPNPGHSLVAVSGISDNISVFAPVGAAPSTRKALDEIDATVSESRVRLSSLRHEVDAAQTRFYEMMSRNGILGSGSGGDGTPDCSTQ